MEKLIELLNEFRPTVSCANFKEHYEFIDDDVYLIREWMDGEEEQFPMYVCYKKGDFIKWLVENDKIDIKKLVVKWEMRSGWDFENKKWDEEEGEEIWNKYWSELCLMLLSISDTPIEDLLLYLK